MSRNYCFNSFSFIRFLLCLLASCFRLQVRQTLWPRFIFKLAPAYGWPFGQCVFSFWKFLFGFNNLNSFLRLLLSSKEHSLHTRCPRLLITRLVPEYWCPSGHSERLACQLLFFWCMSRILSLCVPRNRCDGFTQLGLSHLWHTSSRPGSSLCHKVHANLWAFHFENLPLFLTPNSPYPQLFLPASQGQQSSAPFISTLLQNLCMIFLTKRGL